MPLSPMDGPSHQSADKRTQGRCWSFCCPPGTIGGTQPQLPAALSLLQLHSWGRGEFHQDANPMLRAGATRVTGQPKRRRDSSLSPSTSGRSHILPDLSTLSSPADMYPSVNRRWAGQGSHQSPRKDRAPLCLAAPLTSQQQEP